MKANFCARTANSLTIVIKLGLKECLLCCTRNPRPKINKDPGEAINIFPEAFTVIKKSLIGTCFFYIRPEHVSILWDQYCVSVQLILKYCRIPQSKECLVRFLSSTTKTEKKDFIPNHYLLLPAFPIMAFLSVYLFYFYFSCLSPSYFFWISFFSAWEIFFLLLLARYGQQLICLSALSDLGCWVATTGWLILLMVQVGVNSVAYEEKIEIKCGRMLCHWHYKEHNALKLESKF